MKKQSNAHKYLPYSHQRVKEILENDYHYCLINICNYKGTRYGQVQRYHLVNIDTKEIILSDVTLNSIRIILTEEGYPLHNNEVKPCKGAQNFLEYIESIKSST